MLNDGERHLYEFQRGMNRGSFFGDLIAVIFHADRFNQAKLESAFPEEVIAVRRYQTEENYHHYIEDNYMKEKTVPINILDI